MNTVTEFHHVLPARGFASLWRHGAVRGPPGYGPRHRNPGYELTWVREGFASFQLERAHDSITATTGGCIVLTPGELNTPRAAGTLFQVMIQSSVVDEAREQLGAPALPEQAFSCSSGSRLSAISAVLAGERRGLTDDDPLVGSLADALVLALVRPETPAPQRLDPLVRRALDYLAANHAAPIAVDDLVQLTGLPRFTLMRRFKAQTGTSIHRHLQDVRLERAAHALRTSERSVLEIALDHGFTDPSRFARAFRLKFGDRPNRWRARFA